MFEGNVPGTVHIIDKSDILNVKKNGDIVLLPQPSSNPNDPLRWSQRKKHLQFGFLWIWSFLLAACTNSAGPLFTIFTETWSTSFVALNNATSLNFLFLGIGCLFLQPTAMKLGRRIIYIFGTVIYIIGCILGGLSKSIIPYYFVNVLYGFGGAPIDSLVEISSTDVFFMHERSSAFAAIMLALCLGSNLSPVAAGFVVESLDWTWCFWIFLIIMVVLLIVELFVMEDTSFRRDFNQEHFENENLQAIVSHNSIFIGESNSNNDEITSKKNDYKELVELRIQEKDDFDDSSVDHSIPMRTYWKKMQLIESEYNDLRSWFVIFTRPFLLVSYPAVVWGGILLGFQIAWLSLLLTTQSLIFADEPYNFSASSVGLTNLGAAGGNVFGMLYGGKFVDWLTLKLARRNNGVLEPEMRLWAMIVPTILNGAGLLAYGLGSNSGVHWAIPTVIGQGFIGFSMAATGAIAMTYTVDCYEKLASEALVLMLFIRNLLGMVFTLAFQPWLDSCGLTLTTWLLFVISLVVNGTFIIFIVYGKKIRIWTISRYEKHCDPTYGDIWNRDRKKNESNKIEA